MLGIAGVLYLAPAIIGIFWGAPLIARELETGTFRLAWNQSVTRTRWLAVKLALIGLAAMAVTGRSASCQAWWAAPIDQAAGLDGQRLALGMGRFSPLVFGARGIAPIGYAAFAFALGVTAGVLIRRTVPAMAVTLVVFAAVQIAMPLWIRPHLFPPATRTASLSGDLSGAADDKPRRRLCACRRATSAASPGPGSSPAEPSTQPGIRSAPSRPPASQTATHPLPCLASHGIRVAVTYQPASRYWALQWTETAIYLALALALAGFCFWRVSRRRY